MHLISPELVFWFDLALKMALTATVVVITSIAVERSGPFIGALIGALPTAAGAAYVILAIEHSTSFIAASAIGTIAASAAVAIFAATYAVLAQRHGLLVSLGAATIAWFAVAYALRLVDWTPWGAVAVSAVVYAVTIPLSWRYRTASGPIRFVRRRFDMPLRALTVAVVVAVVTAASSAIGSFASGVFALFPIILGSAIVIMHPRIGGKATASMLAHTQLFLIGLGLGAFVLHDLAVPLGVWSALLAALAVNLVWSGCVVVVATRRHSPA